jgi:hypothetical protein
LLKNISIQTVAHTSSFVVYVRVSSEADSSSVKIVR